MDTSPFIRLWGKSAGLEHPYPLIAHLVDTSAAAYSLLTRHLPTNTMRAVGIVRADDDAVRRFALIAGLHDLGKASPAFQRKDPAQMDALGTLGFPFPAGVPIRHERCTQMSLVESVGVPVDGIGGPLSGLLGEGCMLGGHHGVFAELTADELRPARRSRLVASHPGLGAGVWASVRVALLSALSGAVGVSSTGDSLEGPELVVGAGLVVLADWIASQEAVIGDSAQWPEWDAVDWGSWFSHKVEVCEDAIRRTGIGRAVLKNLSFEATFGFAARPLQGSLEQHLGAADEPAGVLLLTAPMGVGKTEAALRASRLMGGDDAGLLFLLPTMATTDAMFERVSDYAKRVAVDDNVNVGLVHSMASLNESYSSLPDGRVDPVSDDSDTRLVATRWLRGRQRTLLAPVAAATIDQLLAATLRSRRGFLRWLGLSGKTVVIDEAHSFDAYMHGLLETALQWLGRFKVPVIVMSATMPSRVSGSLVRAWCSGAGLTAPESVCPYPGWLHVGLSGKVTAADVPTPLVELHVRRVDVADWRQRWTDAVLDRLESLDAGGCALVVCNTVREAQILTETLLPWALSRSVDVRCLHSRFTQADRRRITDGVVSSFGPASPDRPHRSVLIGTQIVEQSLDVDFDVVISCLAPVAQLLQRSGRGHRHQRPRPDALSTPTLEVLVPVGADGGFEPPRGWTSVYPAAYLERTVERSLGPGELRTWLLPQGVQQLVDDVYGTLADIELADPNDPLTGQADREWAERHVHLNSRIPAPADLSQLAQLTAEVDESLMLSTRLGIDSVLVVCAWQSPTGLSLDRTGSVPMPDTTSPEATRLLIGASVPLRSSAATDEIIADQPDRPSGWSENPWLADAALLVFDPETGTARTALWGYRLDPLVGLIQERLA